MKELDKFLQIVSGRKHKVEHQLFLAENPEERKKQSAFNPEPITQNDLEEDEKYFKEFLERTSKT